LTLAQILSSGRQKCPDRHEAAVAESADHRRMKLIVKRELEQEGYGVLEEPLFPPSRRVSWSAYRPDLLGHRREGGKEELAIVECETHPDMKRFRLKNFASLWFQPFLFEGGSIRRVLAVPRGSLRAVDLRLRKEWEIWVLGGATPIIRIGLLGNREESAGPQICAVATADPRERRPDSE
jgi:hypothetical protein